MKVKTNTLNTNIKHTIEFVKTYFKERGCEYLSTDYKNNRTLIPYMCVCGNITQITFDNFSRGRRCMKCSGNERLTLAFVKAFFKKNNCECLATSYTNNRVRLPYICVCGNKSEISFSNFKKGRRCNNCKESKGEKSIVVSLKKRQITYEREWRIKQQNGMERYRFDFAIAYNNKLILIEYNGEQHYIPCGFNNCTPAVATNNLIKTQKRDSIKKLWCQKNNVPLLIIPYWEFNNIDKILANFLSKNNIDNKSNAY